MVILYCSRLLKCHKNKQGRDRLSRSERERAFEGLIFNVSKSTLKRRKRHTKINSFGAKGFLTFNTLLFFCCSLLQKLSLSLNRRPLACCILHIYHPPLEQHQYCNSLSQESCNNIYFLNTYIYIYKETLPMQKQTIEIAEDMSRVSPDSISKIIIIKKKQYSFVNK